MCIGSQFFHQLYRCCGSGVFFCSCDFWKSVVGNCSACTSNVVFGFASSTSRRRQFCSTAHLTASDPCIIVIATHTSVHSAHITVFTLTNKQPSTRVLHHCVFAAFLCLRAGYRITWQCDKFSKR